MKNEKAEQKKITPREKDFSQWYLDIIDVAELAEHSPVRGAMVIKPYGYAIWENIQKILNEKFKKTGVKNAYFPLFIPEKFLKKESEHIEGFSPELAVVTHAGGKELEEPLVVRPTSETIIYDTFSRWIKSYRDLPLLINQWANVVRWELRPRLFLRTTEFLWQEGHTVHKTEADAEERTLMMLEVYKNFAESYLAIPVISGLKTDTERFAGALRTYSIEGMMQDGKALQMGTSHNLGQNFSKAFGIKFLDEDNSLKYGWQTSWGVSTRTIGALIMAHSDDKGLILPPNIAPIKVVIIPIWSSDEEKVGILKETEKIALEISSNVQGNVEIDTSDLRTGEKFYYWEKRGVPLRVEIGPKEIKNKEIIVARRDTSEKAGIKINDVAKLNTLLEDIQKSLFEKAEKFREEHTKEANSLKELKKEVEEGNFVYAYWDGTPETEEKINQETGATIRCIPLDLENPEGKCVYSGSKTTKKALFAKAY